MQLVERFGTARDTWIAADLGSWLAPNRLYSGLADALRSLKQREDVYIVTTKQVTPIFLNPSTEIRLELSTLNHRMMVHTHACSGSNEAWQAACELDFNCSSSTGIGRSLGLSPERNSESYPQSELVPDDPKPSRTVKSVECE